MPEQKEPRPQYSREKSRRSKAKNDGALKNTFQAASESSGQEATFFEKNNEEEEETPAAGKPQTKNGKVNRPAQKEISSVKPQTYHKDAVHFLLIGRHWPHPAAEILMIVTLVPESCAHLTALDPDHEVTFREQLCPIGELMARGADYDCLSRTAAVLSGLEPQFYIDLNLDGFVKMVELLHKEGQKTALNGRSEIDRPAGDGGKEALSLLCDFQAQIPEKENRLIDCLLRASEIRSTRTGFKLLWIGYQNLTTDLNLSDLIQLRSISEKISPLELSLTVIER